MYYYNNDDDDDGIVVEVRRFQKIHNEVSDLTRAGVPAQQKRVTAVNG